jgi:hypothetical protein
LKNASRLQTPILRWKPLESGLVVYALCTRERFPDHAEQPGQGLLNALKNPEIPQLVSYEAAYLTAAKHVRQPIAGCQFDVLAFACIRLLPEPSAQSPISNGSFRTFRRCSKVADERIDVQINFLWRRESGSQSYVSIDSAAATIGSRLNRVAHGLFRIQVADPITKLDHVDKPRILRACVKLISTSHVKGSWLGRTNRRIRNALRDWCADRRQTPQ